MDELATLNGQDISLVVKFKDGSNTYAVSTDATADDLFSTGLAIKSLREGEFVGYYKTETSQILPL